MLIIAFDDEKTSVEVIIKALSEGKFPVKDKPAYLKALPIEPQSN